VHQGEVNKTNISSISGGIMSESDIIGIIFITFVAFILISYGVYMRAYSQGFKNGLEMGMKIGKSDAQLEKNIRNH
jgi:hypothetical protein